MTLTLLGAAVVGLSLGFLGSGSAILTMPILVYLVGHDEKIAVSLRFSARLGKAIATWDRTRITDQPRCCAPHSVP